MSNTILLIIKGFIMGIANLIPGLSGGTIALTLGIYNDFINSLAHFKRDFKKNISFIIPVFAGLLISFVTMSTLIGYVLVNHTLPTAMFFTGLVAGGIPMIVKDFKKIKSSKIGLWHILIFKCSFFIVLIMAVLDIYEFTGQSAVQTVTFGTYIIIFLAGILVAGTMILPGISGSLLLMLLGLYDTIISALSAIGQMSSGVSDIFIILTYGAGLLIGLVAMSRLIEYLFKSHREKTFVGILGFMFSSVICLPFIIIMGTKTDFSLINIVISAILLVVGYSISYKLE